MNPWQIELLRLRKDKWIAVIIEVVNGRREYLKTELFPTARAANEYVALHNREGRETNKKSPQVHREPMALYEGRLIPVSALPKIQQEEPDDVLLPDGGKGLWRDTPEIRDAWERREALLGGPCDVREEEDEELSSADKEVLEWTLAGCPEAEEEREQERKE